MLSRTTASLIRIYAKFFSLGRKRASSKSVSISVVGLMTEPGSGFDNFDANDIHGLEKPLLVGHNSCNNLSQQQLHHNLPTAARENSNSISSLSKKFNDVEKDSNETTSTSPTSTLHARLRRYQKPMAISLFALGFVLVMTLSVLYWNYYETVSRRSTKKQSVILDHWGKGSSSSFNIDPDAEKLRETLDAKERTKNVVDVSDAQLTSGEESSASPVTQET